MLDYFNAVIALTATPALQTTEIFGEPVYTYSYREAVLDGYLIDHDAPHQLKTKLSEQGITINKGDTIKYINKKTGKIDTAYLDDDVKLDVDQFNRKVIVPEFNRAVLAEIAKKSLSRRAGNLRQNADLRCYRYACRYDCEHAAGALCQG